MERRVDVGDMSAVCTANTCLCLAQAKLTASNSFTGISICFAVGRFTAFPLYKSMLVIPVKIQNSKL